MDFDYVGEMDFDNFGEIDFDDVAEVGFEEVNEVGFEEVNEVDCEDLGDIDVLPDKCLINILSLLPLRNRLCCAETCRRWRILALTFSVPTHLDVKNVVFDVNSGTITIGKIRRTLQSFLSLYGANLISIDLNTSEISINLIDLIVEFCPKLQRLHFQFVSFLLPVFDLAELQQKFSKLDQLTELKELRLTGIQSGEGTSVFRLNLAEMISSPTSPVTHLELVDCRDFEIKSQRLTHLHLFGGEWRDGSLAQICKDCPNLIGLKLASTRVWDLCVVAKLSRLVELEISATQPSSLNDSTLAIICFNCCSLRRLKFVEKAEGAMKQLNDFSPLRALQLEEFEIDCANFNDSALDAVAKPSLSKLSFPSENVSDTGLKRLAEAAENLEELELFQKELVANCGLKEILSKCQRLRVLTLRTNLLDFEVFKQLGQCEALRKLRISRLDIAIENSMRLLLESRVERNIKSDLEVTVDIYFPHEESEVDMSEFNTELLANTIRLHIGTLDTSKMPKKVFEVAIAPRVTRSNWSFWPEGFDFDSLKNSLGSVQNTLQN